MQLAFLLRFQEPCLLIDQAGSANGTRTGTKILGEKADPKREDYRAILAAGTITKIKGESGGDRAINGVQMHTIPRSPSSAGTVTKTAIKGEVNDRDARQSSIQAVPRCS